MKAHGFSTVRKRGGQRFSKLFGEIEAGKETRISASFKDNVAFMCVDGKSNSVTEQISDVSLDLTTSGPLILTSFVYFDKQLSKRQVISLSKD